MTEQKSETEPPRLDPWDLFVGTSVGQFFGLLVFGVFSLVTWAFGFWPGLAAAVFVGPLFAGADMMVEHYRTRPPRRRLAAVAGMLTWVGMALLGAGADSWLLPEATPEDLGFFVGSVVGFSCGSAVFARVVNGASTV
ncbi:hypothetical protein [Streptomyces sp. NPDC056672]|uniref:hypothetical protein n=1 Tax=Streptomyces sp. NPDC056672 TaxID=3345906 RepID=UPI0036B6ECCD